VRFDDDHAVAEALMTHVCALGAGPGETLMTIDLNSTTCEVHGANTRRARVTATPRC
jgi:hypothetical protein